MQRPITAEARLRRKSQLTLPDQVVQAAHLGVGDRFLVELAPDDPNTIHLHRIRRSYAGALDGMYGAVDEYVAGERTTWKR